LIKLSARVRKAAIARIVEARFSLSIFEEMMRKDPRGWKAKANDMCRGIYAQAILERERLQTVPDEELRAEAAAMNCALPARRG
jgi:hypothetical protein